MGSLKRSGGCRSKFAFFLFHGQNIYYIHYRLVANAISRKGQCIVEDSAEAATVAEDVPVGLMDAKPSTDPKTPHQWSLRERLGISGYLFNMSVLRLLSLVGEVATRTKRLSAALMHMEEEGVKFLQSWSGTPVRFG